MFNYNEHNYPARHIMLLSIIIIMFSHSMQLLFGIKICYCVTVVSLTLIIAVLISLSDTCMPYIVFSEAPRGSMIQEEEESSLSPHLQKYKHYAIH